ncbi:hypothetical protein BGZ99_005966 [Dissophora globulifera]|uniref:Uncharacterized protein n=1 Tax=Dissophora globulifera TaxID=979702 RepID=A0A9P6USY2_9FUNG|nr:hypothetical protein BGZ99_005966 [Dissophora globulifera]
MADTNEQHAADKDVTAPSAKSSPTSSADGSSSTLTAPASASLPAKPTPVSKAPKIPTSEYDYFIVLDFEATCDDNKPAAELLVTGATSEIIEFAWICVTKNNFAILHEEQKYVKPLSTPLTPFCQALTNITPETLQNAGSLQEAIDSLDAYINTEILDKGKSFCFVTHGAWDLRIQLQREAKDKGIVLPAYLKEPILFDLKEEATKWIAHHAEVVLKSFSLEKMCEAFAVSMVGRLHSGLDDSKTIVNIMKYLVAFAHPDVFMQATDPVQVLNMFKKEESKIVRISSLSFDITQTELEAFFAAKQLKPKELVMQSNGPNTSRPSGGGFAVFEKHADALAALELNGALLGQRTIEITPSSRTSMETLKGKLSNFQQSAKNSGITTSRPGDWVCNMCQFTNYASRRACFKCHSPSPEGAVPTQPPNFASGDWMCPNAQCNFHNYASRTQCFRCQTQRPGTTGPGNSYGNGGPMASPHHHSHHSHHHHPYASGGGAGGSNSITFRPGDWACPNCSFQNFASRTQCMKCGTPAPSGGNEAGSGGSGGGGYRGGNSGYGGYNDQSGGGYGGRGGSQGGSYGGGAQYGSQGGNVGYSNSGAPSGQGGHSFRPGDWSCPSCNSHNFASRFQCMRCGLTKPPQRDSSPAPSYTPTNPMKPGDWICPNSQCGYHNFAKRTTCARCNANAPAPTGPSGGIVGGLGGAGGSGMGYYGTQQHHAPPPQQPAPVQNPGYSPMNPSYGSYGGPTYGSQQPQQGYGSYGSQQYGPPSNRY